jgi:CheY-like chemotaxis protein
VQQLTVLLVDDDEPNTRTLARLLIRNLGYEVDIAHSCEEALPLLSRRRYDLALVDIR